MGLTTSFSEENVAPALIILQQPWPKCRRNCWSVGVKSAQEDKAMRFVLVVVFLLMTGCGSDVRTEKFDEFGGAHAVFRLAGHSRLKALIYCGKPVRWIEYSLPLRVAKKPFSK